MCGICGIYNFNKRPVDLIDIKKMNNSMISRGPDDFGELIDSNFGFGMRRLSIIDIENGKQPIFSNNKRFKIVFNGEIYNYRELRFELEKKGYFFKTKSDTEVIANLFQDKGINSFIKLNGMFAISVWDSFSRTLYLARDRVGIKPLYYYLNNNKNFYFCSSLDGILKVLKKEMTIDDNSFYNYLAFSYVPHPLSIYKNVKKLEPGKVLIVEKSGTIKKYKFWNTESIKKYNDNGEQKSERLIELLKESIKIQMRSDVPIGTFLSGGFDSSSIVALMSAQLNRPIKTFTINFENGIDESKVANLVAKKFNTDHTTLNIERYHMKTVLNDVFQNLDEPMSDNSIFPTYLLSKLVKDQGLKVILNGTGGDELFGGYLRYLNKNIMGYPLQDLPNSFLKMTGTILSLFNSNIGESVKSPSYQFYKSISGLNIESLSYLLKDKNDVKILLKLIKNKYNQKFSLSNTDPKSLMLLDFKDYLSNDVLALLDKMTMSQSVEGRVPFLENNLIDFAFSLSNKDINRNNELKWFLKSSMRKILPKEIYSVPKSGFSGPVKYWMHSYFKEDLIDTFRNNKSTIISEKFDIDKINKIISLDVIPNNFISTIFSIYAFEKWEGFK
jgi:asparagine synthase (glutamine-hydrolysing)